MVHKSVIGIALRGGHGRRYRKFSRKIVLKVIQFMNFFAEFFHTNTGNTIR
jgi:hypothetical protein